ncbi:hypothetical protein HHK36_010388 [Tetracentron sinense]|uniref:O-methyltransferase C-terminal domain-containing protein n=1 Tax=Tetracentron sinense TaxID=13715 RepID=A0A835DJ70_TETSI|nr:hypothetical protein HHK36_010388 [Tetracentron sinense]
MGHHTHSKLFSEAMACDARVVVPAIVDECCDVFGGVGTLVDVGGADGTTLRWVLHDWGDEECIDILRKSREANPEDKGKVLTVEAVIEEEQEHKLKDVRPIFRLLISSCSVDLSRSWLHKLDCALRIPRINPSGMVVLSLSSSSQRGIKLWIIPLTVECAQRRFEPSAEPSAPPVEFVSGPEELLGGTSPQDREASPSCVEDGEGSPYGPEDALIFKNETVESCSEDKLGNRALGTYLWRT